MYSFPFIKILTVENINTFLQDFCSPFAIILQVVVFPLVPVTHMIIIFLDGNPYKIFAFIALILWYKSLNGLSIDIKSFIFLIIFFKINYLLEL